MCVCTGLHIVDFHNFQSLFLHKPKPRTWKSFQKRRPRSRPQRRALSAAPPPRARAQTPGIAFGIRDPILLLLCKPSVLACSRKPAFSYKRHLVQTPLTSKVFCTFSTAQCKLVLTGTTHGDSVANAELFSVSLPPPHPPHPRDQTAHRKCFSCFVLPGATARRCVCVCGCRL